MAVRSAAEPYCERAYRTAEQSAAKDQEIFLPMRPGAQKPGGRKNRVAPVGMTGTFAGALTARLKPCPDGSLGEVDGV